MQLMLISQPVCYCPRYIEENTCRVPEVTGSHTHTRTCTHTHTHRDTFCGTYMTGHQLPVFLSAFPQCEWLKNTCLFLMYLYFNWCRNLKHCCMLRLLLPLLSLLIIDSYLLFFETQPMRKSLVLVVCTGIRKPS